MVSVSVPLFPYNARWIHYLVRGDNGMVMTIHAPDRHKLPIPLHKDLLDEMTDMAGLLEDVGLNPDMDIGNPMPQWLNTPYGRFFLWCVTRMAQVAMKSVEGTNEDPDYLSEPRIKAEGDHTFLGIPFTVLSEFPGIPVRCGAYNLVDGAQIFIYKEEQ